MTSLSHLDRLPAVRVVYGLGAAALFAAAILVAGPGAWQVWFFALAPDLALFAGAGRGLAPGQLHPRAVPLYNALHRFVGPAALALASIWVGPAWLAGAAAWGAHVALDRAVGYGLRTPEGFQRGR